MLEYLAREDPRPLEDPGAFESPAELEGLVLLSASFAQRLLPGILLTALLDDIAAADSRTLIAAFGVSQLQKKISMISTRWLPAVRSLHRLYSLR